MVYKSDDEIAVFKFSVIAPVVTGVYQGPAARYFEEVSSTALDVPGVGKRTFSPKTLRSWLHLYRKHGLPGLSRPKRRDAGKPRKLSEVQKLSLQNARSEYPNRPTTLIYQDLCALGELGNPPCSLSTVQRYLSSITLPKNDPAVERKRFVMSRANECWQIDVLLGPQMIISGRKLATNLITVLDDASRLVPHAQFFFQANTQALETVLKAAFLRRGLPLKIFSDNGKIFSSLHIRSVLAKLGIVVSYARPYSPESRGKIERFFRTLREQFLSAIRPESLKSLDELNSLLYAYVFDTYNLRPHSSLDGLAPLDRFLKDASTLRTPPSPKDLDMLFLWETTRNVSKDAVIQVEKVKFEVPQSLIGHKVKVLYDPHDLSSVSVFADDAACPVTVSVLNPEDNARIPRIQNQGPKLSYTDLFARSDM